MAPALTSIGTVLIDHFEWYDDANATEPSKSDKQVGGGSLYAIIGARVWLNTSQLKMMIQTDSALDGELSSLAQFGKDIWCFAPNSSIPRTLIEYRGKARSFKYTHQPVDLSPTDFINTPIMNSEYVHMVASPTRVLQVVGKFEELGWYPKIVWEPHPMWCNASELENLKAAMKKVFVLSPNHEELADMFNVSSPSGGDLSTSQVEAIAQCLLDNSIGPSGNGSIVIRCGSKGSCSGTRKAGFRWLPPYWRHEDQGKVVDTTGAGNAFLGGLAAGLYFEKDDIYAAVPYATVSASLVIQQFGLPHMQLNDQKAEVWNGDDPRARLQEYLERQNVLK